MYKKRYAVRKFWRANTAVFIFRRNDRAEKSDQIGAANIDQSIPLMQIV